MGKYLQLKLLFVLLLCAVGTLKALSFTLGDLNYEMNADNATVTEPYVSLDGHNGRDSFSSSYYIKDVMVIGGNQSEVNTLKAQYQAEGWIVVDKNLNAGCGSGSDFIYLLYKAEPSEGVNTGFITAFYISNNGDPIEDSLTYNLRTYLLVPYDGGSHFVNRKGDLNSNAGGADIHLYYTRETFYNNQTVTGITFNSTQSGAVPLEGSGSGYDLNTGCGASTDDIYMHVTTETAYADFVYDNLIYGFNPDGISVTVKGHNILSNPTGELNFHDSVYFDYNGHYYTVTRIGYEAFRDCTGLTGNLTIPNSVTTIEGGAFRNCSGLTGDLTIPNSVTTIGGLAFRDCTGFNGNLTISNSLTVIGPQAFRNCSGLIGDLTIPNSVTTIEAYTFCDCGGFNGSLTIPNSVTSIGNLAFYSCSGLNGSLTIPNSVTSIGDWAFAKCNNLTGDLTIPNSMTSIGRYAFYDCTSIDGSLTIPNSVTTIGDWAFANCKLSGNLMIPNSVTLIGAHAFSTCLYFTGILAIPNSVTTIGSRAFYQCIQLTGLTLGDSLTTIEEEAFCRCYDLTGSLTIPKSVTTIGAGAFRESTGLTEVNSLAETPPTLGDDVFGGWDKTNTPVHVPYGSLEAYNGWGGFSNIMETFGYFITDVMVIGGTQSEVNALKAQYQAQGWTLINKDLNAGCGSSSDYIYLLYKAELSDGPNTGFITDFYITDANGTAPDDLTYDERTYYLTPYYGGSHFVNLKGDLNSNAGGADIHLYYTKDIFPDNRAVTGITFNSMQSGAVPLEGSGAGYDLNKDCGTETEYIYMHISTSEAFDMFTADNLIYAFNPDGATVILKGHVDGTSTTGELYIPENAYFDYNGHYYLVTAIEAQAFDGYSGFTGSLTIPGSVATIGERAFENCVGFYGSLIIGNSVTAIGSYAFHNCTDFTEINSHAEMPPALGDEVFGGWDKSNTPVYVPVNSLMAYSSIPWGGFSYFCCVNDNVVHAQYYPEANDPESPFVVVYWGDEPAEDFETGDFSQHAWQIDATHPWTITTNNPYEGGYCMKSGGAGVANAVSNMTITVTVPFNAIISFFSKISSEGDWDKGYFYIDGVNIANWSGNGGWAEHQYSVSAGQHTFQWRYVKDFEGNMYDDCFYVDNITFYRIVPPAVPCDPSAAIDPTTSFDLYRANADTTNVIVLAEDYGSHYFIDSTWMNLAYCDYIYGVSYAGDANAIVWSGSAVTKPQLITYEITAIANPTEGGTVTGAGTYSYGETATLTATANEGYMFTNWTKGGVEVSTNVAYTFTVTEAALLVANFEPSIITQTTTFLEGWNWWSCYVELDGLNGLNILQEGLGTNGVSIKSQNYGACSFLEGYGWYGPLTAINNESSYKVRLNGACTVSITNEEINPASHPITIVPGWNWIGYPVNASLSLTEAFAGINVQSGDMVKSQNDGVASYLEGFGWYGALNTIHPGMGLMYKSMGNETVTLTYPTGGIRNELKPNQTADGNHWWPNLNAYANNMSVMAIVEVDGQVINSENYELAAFANGEVRGSARLLYVAPLDRYFAFLNVAGDETVELHFGLYDTETGAVLLQNATALQYVTNSVIGSFAEPYVVSFHDNTGMDEWTNPLKVYPNPVEHGQSFSLGFAEMETGLMQVEIIDALGTVVETLRTTSLPTINAPETAGVYTLRLTIKGKGTCYRKLVVR